MDSSLARRLASAATLTADEPDLYPEQKAIIVQLLRTAYQILVASTAPALTEGEEDVTEAIQRLLNSTDAAGRSQFKGMDRFESVTRGTKVSSANSNQVAPDLHFRPIVRPAALGNASDWGWFIECKIIGDGRTMADYGKDGVARFVDGRYAQAMPSAAMVAYVRNGKAAATELPPLLGQGQYRTVAQTAAPTVGDYGSEHARGEPTAPSRPIALTHVWLAPGAV